MTSSGRSRPLPIGDEHRAEFRELLLRGLRTGLDSDDPASLLGTASTLLGILSGATDPAATTTFIRSVLAWDRPEASAGAFALATLAGDDDLRRQLRRKIADRGHHLPSW